MANSIFAASSTTPPSSSERVASEFMAQGRPSNPAMVPSEGQDLGGFEIKTPKVGDGFVEWAINGYDLNGRTKTNPGTDNYDKHGDWLFDKSTINVAPTTDAVNDNNYSKKGK